MEWTADVSADDWLRDGPDAGLTESTHSLVPRDFTGDGDGVNR